MFNYSLVLFVNVLDLKRDKKAGFIDKRNENR